ncbi:MAG: radical SAM protein [Atribacterota bacterium]|nr:radical SAM protein [Atribacterota bacterium]
MKELSGEFGSWLTINRACNLKCSWCYARAIKTGAAKHNMSMGTVRKSVEILADIKVKRVILIGGEPTIHPDFFNIVKIVKESGLTPAVITNSIKFGDYAFLDKAIKLGIGGITTSLKGFSKKEYVLSTGKDMFNVVARAIKNLASCGINHNVSLTIGHGFSGDFEKMLNLFRWAGVNYFSVDMEEPTIVDGEAKYSICSTPKSLADLFVKTYSKLENCGIDFVMKIYVPFCLFPNGFIDDLKRKKRIISGCHVHRGNGIIINPSGKILPCNHFCENSIGEIGKDFSTKDEYLRFRSRPDILEFYNTLSSYPHEKCKACKYWPECGAGCRINWLCFKPEQLVSL